MYHYNFRFLLRWSLFTFYLVKSIFSTFVSLNSYQMSLWEVGHDFFICWIELGIVGSFYLKRFCAKEKTEREMTFQKCDVRRYWEIE